MLLASRNPEAVKKLVIWSTNCSPTLPEIDASNKTKDLNNWDPSLKRVFEQVYGNKLESIWQKAVEFYPKHPGISKDILSKIRCPTLILHGDKDPLIAKHQPDDIASYIKNAQVYRIPEATHHLHQEFYEEFNEVTQDFLLKE